MTITVAKLKRAAEEAAETPGLVTFQRIAFEQLCQDPAMLTILAEKLSERPDSDDSDLRRAAQLERYGEVKFWIARADCPTLLGDVCKQGGACCQLNPEWIASGEPDRIMPLTDESDDDYQRRASGT